MCFSLRKLSGSLTRRYVLCMHSSLSSHLCSKFLHFTPLSLAWSVKRRWNLAVMATIPDYVRNWTYLSEYRCTVISLFSLGIRWNCKNVRPCVSVVIPFSKECACVCVCVSKSKKKKRGARKGDLLSISLSLLISYSILSRNSTGPTAVKIHMFEFRFLKFNKMWIGCDLFTERVVVCVCMSLSKHYSRFFCLSWLRHFCSFS